MGRTEAMQTLEEVFTTAAQSVLVPAKAPSAVANPLAVAAEAMGTGMLGSLSGDKRVAIDSAAEQYAHNQGSVFSAISIPSKRIAGQPVFVGRITKNPQKSRTLKSYLKQGRFSRDRLPLHIKELNPENVEIIEEHPLLDTLNDPNDLVTRFPLMMETTASLQLTGQAYWMLLPEDGRIKLIYLPATWVTPVHEKGKFYARWKVSVPGSLAEPIPVPGENMAYFSYPDPADPFGCLAPLQRLAKIVLTDESIQTAQDVTFRNGIVGMMALTVGDGVTESAQSGGLELETWQRNQLLNSIRKQYQGAAKAGLPIILDALVRDVKQISTTPSEMAFQSAGEMTEARIYKGFGVNPISAGQVEGANRASSAVADHHLVSNVINPMAALMSQVITKWIAPHFGGGDREKLVFWIEPAEAFDPELRLKKIELGTKYLSFTRNDLRQELGYPPIDGWDDVPVPIGINLQSDDFTGESDTDESLEDQDKAFHKRYCKTAVSLWAKQHAREEERLRVVLQDYFNQQRKEVIKRAKEVFKSKRKSSTRKDSADDFAKQVFDPQQWDKKLREVVRPLLQQSMVAGALGELSLVPDFLKGTIAKWQKADEIEPGDGDFQEIEDFQVDIPSDVMVDIRGNLTETLAQDYWGKVNETTGKGIGSTIRSGLGDGLSNNQIAKLIGEKMQEISFGRAKMIARTEVTNSLNAGHTSVRSNLERSGLVSGSEWLTAGDGDVRGNKLKDTHDHVSANHQQIGPGKQFIVSGESTPWPGHFGMSAGNRVNCRCVTVSLFQGVVPADAVPDDELF